MISVVFATVRSSVAVIASIRSSVAVVIVSVIVLFVVVSALGLLWLWRDA
jgi:hypothetical protein